MSEKSAEDIKKKIEDLDAFIIDFENNVRVEGEIKFPIEVSAVVVQKNRRSKPQEVGSWVAIRPCDDAKTYLGIYLGEMPNGAMYHYHEVKKALTLSLLDNPAIYVPELKRVIRGSESWWGSIGSPEQLKQISDADIQDVWYVKALKELSENDANS